MAYCYLVSCEGGVKNPAPCLLAALDGAKPNIFWIFCRHTGQLYQHGISHCTNTFKTFNRKCQICNVTWWYPLPFDSTRQLHPHAVRNCFHMHVAFKWLSRAHHTLVNRSCLVLTMYWWKLSRAHHTLVFSEHCKYIPNIPITPCMSLLVHILNIHITPCISIVLQIPITSLTTVSKWWWQAIEMWQASPWSLLIIK